MPLLERVRVEIYLPDLPSASYRDLLLAFEEEFTYSFGGCTTVRGVHGNYLSNAGVRIQDRMNLIYTDLPLALSTNFDSVARYADELKQAAFKDLAEEAVLVVVTQVYHAL